MNSQFREAAMGIIVNLDVMMARRKMSLNELAARVDLTLANLSILKNGKARAIRFSTLESLCQALDCQPGDLLEFSKDDDNREGTHHA
jgi:putative transcriptional regulator